VKIKYFNPDGTETVVDVPDDVDMVQINVETVVEDVNDWATAAILITAMVIAALAYIFG
jgi:hypothetical protein